MAVELVTIDEVRAACYAEPENDDQLAPIVAANTAYVIGATGYEAPESGEVDPRVRNAVLRLCYLDFWPESDKQGNLRRSVTRLIKQIAAEEVT